MHDAIDKPSAIREGEELDSDVLKGYLSEKLSINDPIEISQFPSGYSNLTYFIKTGNEELVLRRPPFGANIKSAHDMSREFKVLSLLKPCFPYVPEALLYESDETILGASFYIMRRVQGIILRNKAPKGVELTPEVMKLISEATVDKLAELHDVDIVENKLESFGKPEGYLQRQVEGWTKRYRNAETDQVKGMDEAMEWLSSNHPTHSNTSFIHNDFKYDNLVLNPQKLDDIIAILDWEMATVGDPLLDLGTTLGYWCEETDHPALKPFNLTWIPGNLTREQVANRYLETRGIVTKDILFPYIFGCFKIGVIVQQIYARYKKGFTKDPRFANLIHVVNACGSNVSSAIKYQRISNFR